MNIKLQNNISRNTVDYSWVHLLNFYKSYVKETDVVLEIGASIITKTRTISKFCHKVIGVEVFPHRIPKNFKNVEYLLGDWQNLTSIIDEESVNIAVANHTIEHVLNDLKALNELYKVLKKDGMAIISTPNRERLIRTFIEFFTGKKKFPSGEHIREYTEKDLISLIKSSKFKKYKIFPLAFGICGGPVFFYSEKVPSYFRRWANFWEIQLFK